MTAGWWEWTLPKFDHWLRHLPPNITGPASRRIDVAMSRYLNGILGSPTEIPELVRKRTRLSGRHFGLGYRSREELVAPVAYVSGFIEAHERFLEGERGIGFFQQLEGLLGRNAFDAGGEHCVILPRSNRGRYLVP